MADSRTFLTSLAIRFGENVNSFSACSAELPRMACATRLSLRGLVRMPRPIALACVSARTLWRDSLPILSSLRLLVGRVTIESARRREFAEFVAHHVFGDEHGNVLVPVVNAKGQADALRQNRGAAR